MTATLTDRVFSCLFYDIAKLAKEAQPGIKLGDINRRFKGEGSSKLRFAEFVVANCPADALEAALPAYENNAKVYRETGSVPKVRKAVPTTAQETPEERSARVAAEVRAEHGIPEPVAAQGAQPVAAQGAQPTDAAGDLARIIRDIAGGAVNEGQVQAICRREIDAAIANITGPRTVAFTITTPTGTTTTAARRVHPAYVDLLQLANCRNRHGHRFNVWLAGPAGSGKTTAGTMLAQDLGVTFYTCGALDSDFRLVGYMDANGNYVPGVLYAPFKNGGVFLLDEADANHEAVMLSLNSALANGFMVFPNGELVHRHADFVLVAAANTWGAGASFAYVGRIKQDDAAMDRFKPMAWDYDTAFEIANSGNEVWARKVIRWRERMFAADIKSVISPRATFDGADLLAQGMDEATVIKLCVRKSLTDTQWTRIS